MNNKDIANIIEFLTPEAKQRFEEGVVDLILNRVEKDLEDYDCYIFDNEILSDKLSELVEGMLSETIRKIKAEYETKMENKIKETIKNAMGI